MHVIRPDLPSADELRPYLQRIDEAGVATNGGQLVTELEHKLGGVAVANATLGLELSCRHVFRNGEVLVPAFTFPATALAVRNAGLKLVLCDVHEKTWAAEATERTLVVCPFGEPAQGTLVDAAGVWPPPKGNAVMSFHATKPLPAGEGGMVFGDEGLLDYVRRARNFGFIDGKAWGGTNAKMSEYHAAVALASLARIGKADRRRREIAYRYETNLLGYAETRAYQGGTIYPVLVGSPSEAGDRLTGYETRRWYCPTLDKHPAFEGCRMEALTVAHYIADHLLCLPFHTYMTDADVDGVCEALCKS
jgi:dTDP-4-amino-4,6-dideoxygalactose transaminase